MRTRDIFIFTFLLLLTPLMVVSFFDKSDFSVALYICSLSFIFMSTIILILEYRFVWYIFSLLSIYIFPSVFFALEVLLFNKNKINKKWFYERYTIKMFKFELILFSPIILLCYVLSMLFELKIYILSFKRILDDMEDVLKENGKEFFKYS